MLISLAFYILFLSASTNRVCHLIFNQSKMLYSHYVFKKPIIILLSKKNPRKYKQQLLLSKKKYLYFLEI